jgi:hypothetical protein
MRSNLILRCGLRIESDLLLPIGVSKANLDRYRHVSFFRVHPDGRRIAFVVPTARKGTEVWALALAAR